MATNDLDRLKQLETIDLSECDYRGRVLEEIETDLYVEDRFFAGWRNLLVNSLPHQPGKASYASFILEQAIPIPDADGLVIKPGMIVPGSPAGILMEYTEADHIGLLCLGLDGRLRWRHSCWSPGFFVPGRPDRPYAVGDVDNDGKAEIAVVNRNTILVLDGADGSTRSEAPTPENGHFLTRRNERPKLNRNIHLCRAHGPDKPAVIVLFESGGCGGHTIWGIRSHARILLLTPQRRRAVRT